MYKEYWKRYIFCLGSKVFRNRMSVCLYSLDCRKTEWKEFETNIAV